MLVVRLVARWLVATEAFPKVALDDEAAPHEELERAVNRRSPDAQPPRAELLRNLLGRQVAAGLSEYVGNRKPLCSDRQVVFAKVGAERLGHGSAARPGPRASRSASPVMCSGGSTSPARRCTPRTTAPTASSGASASATTDTSQRPRSGPLSTWR